MGYLGTEQIGGVLKAQAWMLLGSAALPALGRVLAHVTGVTRLVHRAGTWGSAGATGSS